MSDKKNKVGVMVEIRVPRDAGPAAAFQSMATMGVPGFEPDRDYEPVPVSAIPELAPSLEAAGEEVVLVRGTIEEGKIHDLESQGAVVRVWKDTVVEPFGGP